MSSPPSDGERRAGAGLIIWIGSVLAAAGIAIHHAWTWLRFDYWPSLTIRDVWLWAGWQIPHSEMQGLQHAMRYVGSLPFAPALFGLGSAAALYLMRQPD